MNRRELLKAGLVGATASSVCFYGIPSLAGYASNPAIRRNASTMTENDPILRGYRRAIRAMRQLPDTNQCSWFYQAAIHGTSDTRDLPSWNTCHQDPEFFWAWHRMYLYWFERIIRKYSNMYDWALPYWDWANQAQRALPAAFREPGSDLFDSSRSSAINSGAELSTTLGLSVANAFTSMNYMTAQSGINGPHGSVHGAVGGNMQSVRTAAHDPIFWLHHSNVDRQWNLWLAQGGRSSPVGNDIWRNTEYTFFDECCEAVTMKGCDVVRAARQLGYAYEEEPTQVSQYCLPDWLWEIVENPVLLELLIPITLAGEMQRINLSDAKTVNASLSEIYTTAAEDKEQLVLQISTVEADTQPGISWDVYLVPKNKRPSTDFLLGTMSLFSAGLKDKKHHYTPAEFLFPINRALQKSDGSELEVVFVPTMGFDSDEINKQLKVKSKVSIGSVSIVVDEAIPQPPRDQQEKMRQDEDKE